MKSKIFGLGVLGLTLTLLAADKPMEFKTEKDKASYAYGLFIAQNIKNTSKRMDIDVEGLQKGLKDGLAGTGALQPNEVEDILNAYAQSAQKKSEEKSKVAGEKALVDGPKFLAANKTKPGIKTLMVADDAGTKHEMQYKVIKEGTGPLPKTTDVVTTHYRGTLIDGTEFDSSYSRNEPTSFPVDQVIKGWTAALQQMKVGSKWELYIPSALAYGERGTPGGPIPPNSTLIFEIELIKIGDAK